MPFFGGRFQEVARSDRYNGFHWSAIQVLYRNMTTQVLGLGQLVTVPRPSYNAQI